MVTEVGDMPIRDRFIELTQGAVSDVDKWPQYGNSTSNFVFRADESYIEKDDDRAEGVAYINTIIR